MNFKKSVLGISSLLAFCASLGLSAIVDNPMVLYIFWGITFASALLWLVFNHKLVFQFLTRKSTRYGANVGLIVFLVFGILFFINVLAKEHNWRKDVTRTSANTLSPQSQKVLAGLPAEVKAYYCNTLQEKEKGDDLFKRYAQVSSKLKYEFVDVSRRPTLVQTLGVRRLGAVVLELGDTKKRIMVDGPTEEQVTNGLMKLLRMNEVSVYFVAGHGEITLSPQDPLGFGLFRAELEKQGYSVKELNLYTTDKIPDDAALLILAAPKSALFPKEIELVGNWIKAGGHALLTVGLDINESGLSKGSRDIATLVKPYGIQVMGQMLVDINSRKANEDPQVALGFSGSRDHPITRDFAFSKGIANFIWPLTTYMNLVPNPAYTITPIVVSSDNAWAESDWEGLKHEKVSYNPGADRKGPMDLAYAVETKAPAEGAKPEKGIKFLIFANSIFATNNAFDKVGNRDLILNSIAWLSDDERFISIRAKEDPDALRPVRAGMLFLNLALIFLLPMLVLLIGVWQWWRRSKL